MTTKPNKAEAAYEKAHQEAQSQLARLQELLFDLPASESDDDPIDWGHVGSLGHVNERLAELIAFLSGE
jgi:hypothetical protein